MASPNRYRAHSPEAGLDILCIQFAVGGAGAVGAFQGTGGKRLKEFRKTTPVVLVSTGTYDIFLRESWMGLIDCHAIAIGAVATTSGTIGKVVTNSVTATSNPKVRVTFCRPDTGVAADVTSGDIASITLKLKSQRPD